MLSSLIKKAIDHMDAAIEPDLSNKSRVVEKQFLHISAVIRKSSIDYDDASMAFKTLKGESHFSADQAKALRGMVEDASSSCTVTAVVASNESQKNQYLYNYFAKSRWTKIIDPNRSVEENLEEVTDQLHEIGCDHPDQACTQVLAVGIALVGHGKPFTEIYAYQKVEDLRKQIVHKRKKKIPGVVSLPVYPENANEYVAMNPRAYSASDPPVAPMIDVKTLANALRRISVRDTNKQVRDHFRTGRYSMQQSSSMMAPQLTYGGGGFEQGWHAAQMSFGCGKPFTPDRRFNSKRGARMLGDISREDADGIFSEGRRMPLALLDGRVDEAAPPPAAHAEEQPPADTIDKDDKHGLDAMIAGLHAHAAKRKKGGACKAAAKAKGKAKDKAKGEGAKIAVIKKPAAPTLTSASTMIKCKKGWVLKIVPRGTNNGKKGATYSLYRRNRKSLE